MIFLTINTELTRLAYTVAHTLHHQFTDPRRYTGQPYITHPYSVAELVAVHEQDENMYAAALLHDIVEETPATTEDIFNQFGPIVGQMVKDLTDISKPEDGNREHRKKLDRIHLSGAHPSSKTIKLADMIINSESIIVHDPRFAATYMKEKRLLLEVLREGNEQLYRIAEKVVQNYFAN